MAFPTKQLIRLVASGYPLIYLVSWEEERVEKMLKLITSKVNANSLQFYTWTCTEGLKKDGEAIPNTTGVNEAIEAVSKSEDTGFYFFNITLLRLFVKSKYHDVWSTRNRKTNRSLFKYLADIP